MDIGHRPYPELGLRTQDTVQWLFTGRTARRAALPVLFLLRGRFFFCFSPAGATLCTDQGEICDLALMPAISRIVADNNAGVTIVCTRCCLTSKYL